MLVTKKINNNVALALDAHGAEIVVFGRGVGFPSTPYELSDMSKVQRVFRDVSAREAESLANISDEVLLAAADVAELAKMDLGAQLNPNLALTLADHLQFAFSQLKRGADPLPNPLEPEVKLIYPCEYRLGLTALGMIEARCGARLPNSEATSIALHLVAAESIGEEAAGNGLHLAVESTKIIERATRIVEEQLGLTIDRSSFAFARFAAHFRYLVGRLEREGSSSSGNSSLFREAARDFPDVYACARAISGYLQDEYGWTCTSEELLYLMMHINRLASSS